MSSMFHKQFIRFDLAIMTFAHINDLQQGSKWTIAQGNLTSAESEWKYWNFCFFCWILFSEYQNNDNTNVSYDTQYNHLIDCAWKHFLIEHYVLLLVCIVWFLLSQEMDAGVLDPIIIVLPMKPRIELDHFFVLSSS